MIYTSIVAALALAAPMRRHSELLPREEVEAMGIVWEGNTSAVSSHDLLSEPPNYPSNFTWCNKDGVNYCTPSLNQHIPQYQWIHSISKKTGSGISYATSQPYMACSSESHEGTCKAGDWTCTPENVARACGTFGEKCVGLSHYPNATVAEYGHVRGAKAMMKEIYNRGPIACGIDAVPIEKYTGGIAKGFSLMTDHVISVVGWGTDATEGMYWIVRNSWGEYWGEQGFVRVKKGSLALNSCAWATVKDFTAPERHNQFTCYEDGSNCDASKPTTPVEAAAAA